MIVQVLHTSLHLRMEVTHGQKGVNLSLLMVNTMTGEAKSAVDTTCRQFYWKLICAKVVDSSCRFGENVALDGRHLIVTSPQSDNIASLTGRSLIRVMLDDIVFVLC